MKAIVYRKAGPPSVLEVANGWPQPDRANNQVKVKIFATSVNPIDFKARAGRAFPYLLKVPHVPGCDLAGVVIDCDTTRSRFIPGDKVFGMTDTFMPWRQEGTYAEYACVSEEHLARMPEGMTYEDAASVCNSALTAYQALAGAQLKAGQRVLIHAGSGGVGTIAIQLAKLWGAYVVTTCSANKVSFVQGLGADAVVDYTQNKFEEVYANDPFDVILDLVGGEYEFRSLKVLKKSGYFSHVMNGGWLWKVGIYLETPLELLCVLRGVAHSYLERGHAKGKVILSIAT